MTPEQDLVFFYNYKEPLKKFEEGFGYYGTLLGTPDKTKVQCHFCGGLYGSLSSKHLKKHGLTNSQYKEKVGLSRKTALMSEETRKKEIKAYLKNPHKLAPDDKKRLLEARLNRRIGWKKSLESKNKKGVCPDQLLDKIRKVATHLKRTPTRADYQRYYNENNITGTVSTIVSTFGSFDKAVLQAGFTPVTERYNKISSKELLHYLEEFYKINKRTPTNSDFNRGILPNRSTYHKRFGTLNTARSLAGIPLLDKISTGYGFQWVEITE